MSVKQCSTCEHNEVCGRKEQFTLNWCRIVHNICKIDGDMILSGEAENLLEDLKVIEKRFGVKIDMCCDHYKERPFTIKEWLAPGGRIPCNRG